jgi:hypothetical protein
MFKQKFRSKEPVYYIRVENHVLSCPELSRRPGGNDDILHFARRGDGVFRYNE